jgi:hypothetical protein
MKVLTTIAVAAAALCGAVSAQAQGFATDRDLSRFDARQTQDLPAQFAICDATRFLRTDPDLNATRVYVRRDDGRMDLLLPPYFVGGRAYRRLRYSGQVSYEAVREARHTIGRDMVKSFDRISGGDRRFLNAQSRFCDTLEKAGRRS